MTPKRRIILNVAATYGRSLYTLVVGLFCGRWALMALGEVDYGLYGLVGGLTAFVAFLNGLLSMAVGRFYAISVGSLNRPGNELHGLEECRKWFNSALLMHTAIPVVLVAIGYPLGEWAVRHFLAIPSDRVMQCLWVWRFTCISCFSGMINVPFSAMYNAKQEIAELTIYSFATTTFNALVLYYMITHPGEWLAKYAAYTMVISIVPQFIISWRALAKYKECHFNYSYLWDKKRVCEICKFAMARFWTALSGIFSGQGNAILVNKYLGPVFNASMAIGNTVGGHASTLSGALSGAFWPAIVNKVGEGKTKEAIHMAFVTCRLGTVLVLIFAIPLMIEIDEVLTLWLKIPPESVCMICVAFLLNSVLERMSEGYWMAIMGIGRGVPLYSLVVSLSGFSSFFITWVLFGFEYGIEGVCIAILFARLVAITVRLVLGRILIGMSIRYWLFKVCIPLAVASMFPAMLGVIVRYICSPSFCRICITTFVCESTFLPVIWLFVLEEGEKKYLVNKLRQIMPSHN